MFKIFSISVVLALSASWTMAATPSCPGYRSEKTEFSFKNINPAPEQINGLNFPGNHNVLYRGAYETNPQFNLEKALQGIFFQKNLYVGSPIFWGMTQVLTGQWTLDHTFLPTGGLPLTMREYFEARRILKDIEFLLDCSPTKTYPADEADTLAADLMNKTFNRMSRDEVETRYFNIADPSYYVASVQKIGFGNNAADLIISTTYDMIASLYGYKILVLKDKRDRALDLSFYNAKKNNRYFDEWVDNGEQNQPGYITADEIIGYQQRRYDRARTNWAQSMPNNPIEYAVYRANIDGENVGLVFAGNNTLCMMEANDHHFYNCHNYWAKLMTEPTPYPIPNMNSRAELLGVITTCQDKTKCPVVEKVKAFHDILSQRKLSADIVKRIESTNVNGQKLSYIATTASPAPVTPTIKIISATYVTGPEELAGVVGNVTKQAASFADGNESLQYKISTYHLKLVNPKLPRKFSITYSCDDQKRPPIDVPAPAEDKVISLSCK
jgi:hypothetical protein